MLTSDYQPEQPAIEAAGIPAGGKEITMKVLCATLLSLLITGTQALASAGGGNGEGMGLLATFFVAFGVLIILFQLIPGMALFFGMVKGIFSSEVKTPVQAAAADRTRP